MALWEARATILISNSRLRSFFYDSLDFALQTSTLFALAERRYDRNLLWNAILASVSLRTYHVTLTPTRPFHGTLRPSAVCRRHF